MPKYDLRNKAETGATAAARSTAAATKPSPKKRGTGASGAVKDEYKNEYGTVIGEIKQLGPEKITSKVKPAKAGGIKKGKKRVIHVPKAADVKRLKKAVVAEINRVEVTKPSNAVVAVNTEQIKQSVNTAVVKRAVEKEIESRGMSQSAAIAGKHTLHPSSIKA